MIVSNIVRQEKAAWSDYANYCESRMQPGGLPFEGDDESRALFTVWRTLRNERDGISNPRHKKQNIRFQRA